MYYPLRHGVVSVFISWLSAFAAWAKSERQRIWTGGDGLSGLEENGRRSRRRRRLVGAAVAARVSDERSEESARQDERQPVSRFPRPAVRLAHHRSAVKKSESGGQGQAGHAATPLYR